MPTPPKPEVPPKPEAPKEKGLALFDDFESYQRSLKKTMDRADEIIEMKKRGLTDEEKKKLKVELPQLVLALRQLLEVQLDHNGQIMEIDRADGSYDNADIDNKLRIQLRQLRNLNTDLSRMYFTQTIRKVSSWFTEDLPNWFSVKWGQVKDNLYQFLKATAVVGGLTLGGVLAGYSISQGGILAGVSKLGEHLKVLAAWLGMDVGVITAKISAKWKEWLAKLPTTTGTQHPGAS